RSWASPTFLLLLTLLTVNNEILNELDPLFLGCDQSTAASLVLHVHQVLLMSGEGLAQLLQCLNCGKLCQLFQLYVTQAFRVEDEPDIWCLWCWYLLQSSSASLRSRLISFHRTFFQRRHGYSRGHW